MAEREARTIAKHAVMKLDSLLTDLHELNEEETITESVKRQISELIYKTSMIEAVMVNLLRTKDDTDDNEFINESVEMDEIEPYPESVLEIDDIEI